MSTSIRDRIERFVSEIDSLIRQETLLAVNDALREQLVPHTRRAGSGSRSRGAKRTPAQLAATMDAIVAYVTKHPDSTIEKISEYVNEPTSSLTLPVRKLLAAKKIRKTGQKRGTRYSLRAAAAAKTAAKKKRKPKKAGKISAKPKKKPPVEKKLSNGAGSIESTAPAQAPAPAAEAI